MHSRGLGRKNGYPDRGLDLMKHNQHFNSRIATFQVYLLGAKSVKCPKCSAALVVPIIVLKLESFMVSSVSNKNKEKGKLYELFLD